MDQWDPEVIKVQEATKAPKENLDKMALDLDLDQEQRKLQRSNELKVRELLFCATIRD